MAAVKPSKEILDQLEFIGNIGKIFGAHNSKRIRFNLHMFVVTAFMSFGTVCISTGLYKSWPKVTHVCSGLSFLAFGCHVVVRLISRLVNNDDILGSLISEKIVAFYKREEATEKYRAILFRGMSQSNFIMRACVLSYVALIFILNVVPWLTSWYTGELILLTTFSIPFIDSTTFHGYIVHSLYLFGVTSLSTVIILSTDVSFVHTTWQTFTMVEVYCLKWRQLGEQVANLRTEKEARKEVGNPRTLRRLRSRLSNSDIFAAKMRKLMMAERELIRLIEEFNDYDDLVAKSMTFMGFSTFLVFSLNSLAIALTIIVTLYYSKVIGAVCLIVLFLQVLESCILGTVISDHKNRILDEIGGFPWYELSRPKQKVFLQFLHLCQQAEEYAVLIIGSLNMELFTDIINGIYSYFMYVWNFVKLT